MRLISNTKSNRGFTLLEMMIATAIISAIVGLAMVVLKQATDNAAEITLQAHYENRLQETLSDIVIRAVESSPSKVTLYAYEQDGHRHTALTFPSARSTEDNFILTDGAGQISSAVQWQCLVVYVYLNGAVWRLADYNARSYINPWYVSDVSSTRVTVTDGGASFYFNVDGTPVNANQSNKKLLDYASRLFAFYIDSVDDQPRPPFAPEAIPGVDNPYKEIRPPVNLVIEASVPISHRHGETLTISLETSVLARNQN